MFFKLMKDTYTDTINIETAKTIGQWIKDQYPNVTLYIIGSVLNAGLIHRGSDIDFVIYGIDEITYEELMKKTREHFPDIKVDIRRMEEMDAYTQQKHRTRGYEVL